MGVDDANCDVMAALNGQNKWCVLVRRVCSLFRPCAADWGKRSSGSAQPSYRGGDKNERLTGRQSKTKAACEDPHVARNSGEYLIKGGWAVWLLRDNETAYHTLLNSIIIEIKQRICSLKNN